MLLLFCSSSTTVLKGASQQENLVYQIIQDAGNKGTILRPVTTSVHSGCIVCGLAYW